MVVNLDARTCQIQKFNQGAIPGHTGEQKLVYETTMMTREQCCASDLTPASYLDITRPICYNAEENMPKLTTDFLLNKLKTANPAVGSSVSVQCEAESNLEGDQYTFELMVLPGACRESLE